MTIQEKTRQLLRLDELLTSDDMDQRYEALKTMLDNFEIREKQRHEALMGMLNRVEQRLINAHAFDKPTYAPAVLDWETVQAIAMQQLQENPPKET